MGDCVSYTIEELNRAIEDEENDFGGSWYEFEYHADSRWQNPKVEYPVVIPGIGRAEVIDQHGGEGQGEDLWMIFKVWGHDGFVRYFRRDGYHRSWVGGAYDGPTTEVYPIEKTITVYEEKV